MSIKIFSFITGFIVAFLSSTVFFFSSGDVGTPVLGAVGVQQSTSTAAHNRHLLYQGGEFTPAWKQQFGRFKSRWHTTVAASVVAAEQQLPSERAARAERMFVPLLSSRHKELCCMLADLDKKVAGTTPLDVFVFTVANNAETVWKQSPCAQRPFNITVVFLPLAEHWHVDPASTSSAIHDKSGYVGMPGLFGESYRRMGHWRLTFQFAFADLLGYKYVWQLDDDSFFPQQIGFNMLEYMTQHDLWIAGYRTLQDPHFVTWGLAEIARLYLVGERITPAGPLFRNHTTPPGLDGLYTVRNESVRTTQPLQGDPGGWSRTIIFGNCIVIDMERFWWPAQVQKFVELVLQTGYHWRFRWNEQGVIALVWQMFVPERHFLLDALPFEYVHPRKVWGTCN